MYELKYVETEVVCGGRITSLIEGAYKLLDAVGRIQTAKDIYEAIEFVAVNYSNPLPHNISNPRNGMDVASDNYTKCLESSAGNTETCAAQSSFGK
jgi:hypothetical protein